MDGTTHLKVTSSGTGFAGDYTARVFGMIPHRIGVRIELAGVTSGHLGNAERFAARHGITRAFETHREMLAIVGPDIDCIACANHAHAQYVIEAAEAGVVVGGHPIVNTAILGAIAAATGLVTLENVAAAISEVFPAGAAERNVRAAQLAFERTMVSVG